ncbi:MAG: hypothetical protein AAF416_21730 [Pseudomonadota bacterium]
MTSPRLIVTGDLMRPGIGGNPRGQTGNIAWLHALLSPVLREATGIAPELLVNASPRLGYRETWELAGTAPSDAAWAGLFTQPPPALAARWSEAFADAVVIGFELPPSMCHAIVAGGGRWIDCAIHPVRFMDDIFLGMRASDPEIDAAIADAALPERRAFRMAGAIAAFASRRSRTTPDTPGYTLYTAQMGVDRSMIENGRLLDAAALAPRISEALSGTARLLYKDHPYESTKAIFSAVQASALEVQRTGRNIYELLGDPALEEVVCVSSGTGTEARYFGKRARFIIGPSTPVLWQGDPPGVGHWSVYDAFLAPDFWRRALVPALPVTAEDGDAPAHRPDLLRLTLRSFWGYKDFLRDPWEAEFVARSPLRGALRRKAIQALTWAAPARRLAAALKRGQGR